MLYGRKVFSTWDIGVGLQSSGSKGDLTKFEAIKLFAKQLGNGIKAAFRGLEWIKARLSLLHRRTRMHQESS